eukprot:6466924-Pyramimonas_sp.AAC.1
MTEGFPVGASGAASAKPTACRTLSGSAPPSAADHDEGAVVEGVAVESIFPDRQIRFCLNMLIDTAGLKAGQSSTQEAPQE